MNTDNSLLNKAFVTKVLKSWLGCLRLEELTSARVDAGDRFEQNVWEQGVQLVGDRLLIENDLFQNLKQQWQRVQQRGNEEDFRIAVALPRIYSVERGARYFHPLFVIDVSTIFKGRYSNRGWNLAESFEFQPVLPNLMEFASLSEEDGERLVTQEGIKPFLEATFGHSFNTLQAFLEQVSLPDTPYRAQALPYLVRFSFVAYTYNLKKDLQKIVQQQQYWNWLRPGFPGYEFLFGRPADPDRQVFFAGAFPIDPPTVSQALVLKHARVHPLTAVMGAPGTGKSFLIAHQVAISVVDRAIHFLEQGTDRSNLTLITSTNNRAVQTVEDLFATFDTPFFFLPGGAKDRVDQQVIPRLRSAITWLRTTLIDAAAVAQLSEQILARQQQLQQKLAQDKIDQAQRQADLQLLAQVNADIQALAPESQPLDSPELDYTQFPLTAYEQIQIGLDQIDPSDAQPQGVPGTPRHRSWLLRLWHRVQQWWQKRVTSRDRRALLLEKIERAVARTHTTPFPFELRLPLTAETLPNLRAEVREQLDKAQNWNQHAEAQTAAQPLLAQKAQIEQRLAAHPKQDFYDRFYQDNHAVQQELFVLSHQLLQQVALQRKDEVIGSLDLYVNVLTEDWDARRHFASQWRHVYRDLSLLFPVITSTLHSVRNLFPYPDEGCLDRVIADEAGAISIHQLFPALIRAHKALIVGDPQQLPPVVSFSNSTLDYFRQTEFLDRGLSDEDYDDYSPTACDTANAYQRAAGVSQRRGESGNGIVLREHFRCPPVIARFCDLLCGYGLDIKTAPIDPVLGTHLIGCHVSGESHHYVNHEEIDAIAAWVEHLYSLGYRFDAEDAMKTIGIITPFHNQAKALRQALEHRWQACNRDNTGTTHTYQGGQRAIMIFSACQSRPTDSLQFLNRKPNLLNVTASRTRETLIVVGNLTHLKQGGSYTQMLVDYIEEHGELRQIQHQRRDRR